MIERTIEKLARRVVGERMSGRLVSELYAAAVAAGVDIRALKRRVHELEASGWKPEPEPAPAEEPAEDAEPVVADGPVEAEPATKKPKRGSKAR